MRLSRLVMKEILYRKVNFALGVISVTVAVACLVPLRRRTDGPSNLRHTRSAFAAFAAATLVA